MGALMKAVRAVLAAMAALVWVVVRIGDRLISMLQRQPIPMIDELEPAMPTEVDQARAAGEEAAVRNLAAIVLRGGTPGPEHFAAAGEKASEWLSVMDNRMLKLVVMATNAELHDHMKGRRGIRGLLYFDEETVNEFRIAELRQEARERQAALVSRRYA